MQIKIRLTKHKTKKINKKIGLEKIKLYVRNKLAKNQRKNIKQNIKKEWMIDDSELDRIKN